MTPGFTSSRITHITHWAPGLRTIRLEHTASNFEPGQFFQLALTDQGHTDKRSYSAASPPGAPLEFFVSEVAQGVLSPRLFALEEGQVLDYDPTPLGFFTLSEVPECDVLWLVSTGTGLGPSISVLREGSVLRRFERICVVHGVRTATHLAYADELRDLSLTHSLVYVPVVSQGVPPTDGIRGRLTQAYESGALENVAGLAIDDRSHVLLCGNPAMIEDMSALLKAKGLKKHRRREPGHFNYEKYW